MRKALKQLIYDDLKLCNFDHMAGDTYEIVASRFVAEEGDENVTCETFFAMCCGQVLQKLAKTAQSKVRSKDQHVKLLNYSMLYSINYKLKL